VLGCTCWRLSTHELGKVHAVGCRPRVVIYFVSFDLIYEGSRDGRATCRAAPRESGRTPRAWTLLSEPPPAIGRWPTPGCSHPLSSIAPAEPSATRSCTSCSSAHAQRLQRDCRDTPEPAPPRSLVGSRAPPSPLVRMRSRASCSFLSYTSHRATTGLCRDWRPASSSRQRWRCWARPSGSSGELPHARRPPRLPAAAHLDRPSSDWLREGTGALCLIAVAEAIMVRAQFIRESPIPRPAPCEAQRSMRIRIFMHHY